MNKLGFLVSFFLSLSLFFLTIPSKLYAQELPTIGANLSAYNPPTGSSCNINVPSQYSTIQAGINASVDGDIVCVGPGTYNEDLVVNKSIRLSGRGADQSIINGQSSTSDSNIWVSASNVTIEGFLIKGAGTSWHNASLWLPNGSGDTIRYNWIVSGNGGLAFRTNGIRSNDLIQNNVLEGNNSAQVAAIGAGNNESILNNTFIGIVTLLADVGDSGVVFVYCGTNSLIQQNAFDTGGTVYELMQVCRSPNIVSENNFNSITDRKLRFSGGNTVTLNAENNWWGNTDPANNIIGDVDFTPFALSPFPEYPVPPLNQPPVANAGADQTVFVGTAVNFNGSLSTDPDGNQDIVNYNWNFGDGNTGSGITTTHTYLNSGTYTVTLTVTDTAGASGSDSLILMVQTPAQATQSLIDLVQTFNLQQGIENSLDAKLDAASDSLNDLNQNNNSAAINSLQAFINAVNAQRGSMITDEQADILIQKAQEIINNI